MHTKTISVALALAALPLLAFGIPDHKPAAAPPQLAALMQAPPDGQVPLLSKIPALSALLQPRIAEQRTVIGVHVGAVEAPLRAQLGLDENEGVLIVDVASGKPAAQGGMKQYDVLIKVAGEPVNGGTTLHQKLAGMKAGETLDVTVLRRAKPVDLSITVGEGEDESDFAAEAAARRALEVQLAAEAAAQGADGAARSLLERVQTADHEKQALERALIDMRAGAAQNADAAKLLRERAEQTDQARMELERALVERERASDVQAAASAEQQERMRYEQDKLAAMRDALDANMQQLDAARAEIEATRARMRDELTANLESTRKKLEEDMTAEKRREMEAQFHDLQATMEARLVDLGNQLDMPRMELYRNAKGGHDLMLDNASQKRAVELLAAQAEKGKADRAGNDARVGALEDRVERLEKAVQDLMHRNRDN